ncbi:MAG: hypothetical protein A2991_03560 [Candidatus Terrybacteria bacterium RIFCSPLOWO2_01_FULL_58_14]|uniref:LUD domain-containing protein n=2 Tax=Candidatus Terryibacteriota TaxID=1817920 RepID=A0A1G2PXH5_9BACT|nr:MAG: hypothetical protein A2682_00060 [Candidatus Terrybacteria bacterium RIFCSPHIGHO2_01_FULL_58_15]OHA53027.1 MAG: hypothetical protein A2991_03560 [Candidatus Terrybacteria bacterium RIFCSPLOWO2_01_FULL_58_14]
MQLNEKFGRLADHATLERAAVALEKNGIAAVIVEDGEAAKKKVREIIPEGAEVMTMSSMTLEAIGLVQELNESGRYQSAKAKLMTMDPKTQGLEMRRLGAAPEWAVGSVHAVTEEGTLLVASNTGSQLPAYAYAAGHVIWVVGAQKVVKDTEEGLRRIDEYSFPLEDERAQKAYGVHSFVSKILILNREIAKRRATVIFVKEKLGF